MLPPCVSIIQTCSLNLAHLIFLTQFTFNLAYMLPNYKGDTSLIPLWARNLVKPLMWLSSGYSRDFRFLLWVHLRGKFSQCRRWISIWLTFLTYISNNTLRLPPLLNFLASPFRIFYSGGCAGTLLNTLDTGACSGFVLPQGQLQYLS